MRLVVVPTFMNHFYSALLSLGTNNTFMKDPEEKDHQAQQANDDETKQQPNYTENTNWDKHQQVDEEGNEVGPDDIK
jgi:hypothetical protein